MSLISVLFAAVVVVLIIIWLREVNPGYAAILSMGACVMLMYFVISRLGQLESYIERLTSYASLDIAYIEIILRMIGVAYICRFTGDICRDAGYGAIAVQVEMAGRISLILMSMPVLMSVIDLVVAIVEG